VKALIRKELRENLKFALPGFLIFSLLLYNSYSAAESQPLVSPRFLGPVELVCNLFGLILGWFQVYPEKNRDLWAFLTHRPLTQTQIFLAKAIAGLMIYCVAMGLPMLALVIVASRPGQFASPFEWAMVWPVGGIFPMGAVWYFAGLLMGLRLARWYASRGLILIAALCIYMLAGIQPTGLPGFWQEPVMIVAGIVLLAAATWGAFQSCGTDGGQPAWGRRAVVVSLTVGLTLLGLCSQILFEVLLHGSVRPDFAYFQITKDGVICKVVEKADGRSEITDLSGSPVPDTNTGREASLADFDRLVAPSSPLNVDFGDQSQVRAVLRPDTRFYSSCKTVDRIHWYWTRAGKLAGYDTSTRLLADTIKPDESVAADARFLRAQVSSSTDSDNSKQKSSAIVLATPRHVWDVNLEERKSQILYTAADGDVIGGARSIGDQGFVVATRNLIEMLDIDGKPIWKTTYKSSNSDAIWVRVSRLAGAQKYAVWVGPYLASNRNNEVADRTYSRVLFVSSENGLISETALPPAVQRSFAGWSFWLSALFVPPVPLFYFLLGWKAAWLILLLTKISFGMAIVCALTGWWLGRRYQFSTGTQIKWAIFHLLAGLPGFIAFLSVQEWPARESCPHCRKLRVVNRVQCEHCGEAFAPVEKDGTEIIEKLTQDCPIHA
jgi:hypothetical protein